MNRRTTALAVHIQPPDDGLRPHLPQVVVHLGSDVELRRAQRLVDRRLGRRRLPGAGRSAAAVSPALARRWSSGSSCWRARSSTSSDRKSTTGGASAATRGCRGRGACRRRRPTASSRFPCRADSPSGVDIGLHRLSQAAQLSGQRLHSCRLRVVGREGTGEFAPGRPGSNLNSFSRRCTVRTSSPVAPATTVWRASSCVLSAPS